MPMASPGSCSIGRNHALAAQAFLTNPAIVTEDGDIAPGTILFQLGRSIGEGGMHEDLDLTNHGRQAVRFNLEIAIRCDFADLFEVKGGQSCAAGASPPAGPKTRAAARRPAIATRLSPRDRRLSRRNATPGVYANGRISFEIELEPGATWHTCSTNIRECGESVATRRPRRASTTPRARSSASRSKTGERRC